ncbi:hypothetical protein CLAIMM_02458 [Cladophialophora immunda]|nr:hypothetical protein CLAIMM_02458 [Cladophialophora immunda]
MTTPLSIVKPRKKGRQPGLTLLPENLVPLLTSLPTELLLLIVSFLPLSAVACLILTSKYYHATLADELDLRMQDPEEKARFVRLLEKDLPHLLACYSCNILFDWRKKPKWRCPNYENHPLLNRGSLLCYVHRPTCVSREMVDAFVRGHEKGAEYGPQLHKLAHECNSDGGWYPTRGSTVARSLDARVQQGKLILHGIYRLRVPIPKHCLRPSPGYVDRTLGYSLMPEMVKFNGIGCVHLRNSLPSVLLEGVRHLPSGFEPTPLCHDLISCGYCATDLRVRVSVRDAKSLTFEVEMWRSLGGRDPATRHRLEDAHFQTPGFRSEFLELNQPPQRNLENLFNGGSGKSLGPHMWQTPQDRQTWLQVWMWADGQRNASLWADLLRDGNAVAAVRTPWHKLSTHCVAQWESAMAVVGAVVRRIQARDAPAFHVFGFK